MATQCYFPITPTDVTPVTVGSWQDVDLSALIPAGATGVALHFRNPSVVDFWGIGWRKNGSTDDRVRVVGTNCQTMAYIGVDGSRICEVQIEDADVVVELVGYFAAPAVFFDNGVDKTVTLSAGWLDIDISADTGADTAIAAIFQYSANNDQDCGFRKNGSTDDHRGTFQTGGVIVGVDGSEICEANLQNLASNSVWLVGYIKSGAAATFNTNGVDRSLGSVGSYQDLAALPTGTVAGLYEINSGSSAFIAALRTKGGSIDPYHRPNSRHMWTLVEPDGSLLVEGKISDTGVDFYEYGYFLLGDIEGDGDLAAGAADVTGDGDSGSVGSGTPDAQAAQVDGAGASASAGSGALAAGASNVAGSGAVHDAPIALETRVQRPNPGARIQLFALDARPQGAPDILYFTPTSDRGQAIAFDGIEYTAVDMKAEGFEWSGVGPLPTPKITLGNATLAFSALVLEAGDLVGAALTRIRTFAQYLDGADEADPDAHFPPDQFVVSRKALLNKFEVQFELAAAIDQQGKMLPGRQILRDICRHRYRRWDPVASAFDYTSATCPYAGALYFDRRGEVVSIGNDQCGKRLTDCKKRFLAAPLPLRSFPGVARVR